jgi:hypothetical protein
VIHLKKLLSLRTLDQGLQLDKVIAETDGKEVNGLKHLNYMILWFPYRFNGFNIERKRF